MDLIQGELVDSVSERFPSNLQLYLSSATYTTCMWGK